MDPHDTHAEPEFRMDYSKWDVNNFIAAVIFFGFLACCAAIFLIKG